MRIYQNPIYPNYFADPFVWKFEGEYYAVGTGPITPRKNAGEEDFTSYAVNGDQVAFPILTSKNFVDWHPVGGALRVPAFAKDGVFWAPEVAYDGTRFYMYYSVSVEGVLNQKLRVATSDAPAGPYEDAGPLLPENDPTPFAIDAHPFLDDDGQWYLYYARDFLDTENGFRAGTGVVVDRLLGMTRLAGEPRLVMRPRHEWQRFKANRPMYGGIYDWHTVEGPCVRKQGGIYCCMYSAGCYENDSYGVDFAVSDHVFGPYSDAGGETGPRVLKTIPDQVLGPGHHSVVVGPDNLTEFIVYHAWDKAGTARRMFIDKLAWTPEGPHCFGPTWTPQTLHDREDVTQSP